MNKKELEKLIDDEVARIFSSVNIREPQPEPIQADANPQPTRTRAELSGEELDDIIFYGGEKPQH